MSDLISRETMKDAIDNTTWYHQNRNSVMVEGAHGVEDAWFKAEDVFKAIENVPTAQVNTPTDTPTDTISRQAAIDALHQWEQEYTWDEYDAKYSPSVVSPSDVIAELPSAQLTGRWIFETLDGTPGYRPTVMFCSKCGRVSIADYSYCPHCGRAMK